jgi:glutamate/tyrosine decarboxylase-like PLP-dependent enzyme
MIDTDDWAALDAAREHAIRYLKDLDVRPVDARSGPADIVAAAPAVLPQDGEAAEAVVRELVDVFDPGLVASAGGRFHGWVTGGTYPAGIAADWLTSAWDQLSGPGPASPAANAADVIVGRWLVDLLGLPRDSMTGLVTGTQMASFTALAAGRNAQLAKAGWDVERQGLVGAPPVRVVAGRERHVTIDTALRYLGLGTDSIVPVDCDDQGRVVPAAFRDALAYAADGPVLVCLSAGNVNTGSFDPFADLIPAARDAGVWTHIDGAFGLWAAASPATAHLTRGVELADSWALDAHKWLNAPYDNAAVIVRDPAALLAAMGTNADYLTPNETTIDPLAKVPEMSRRARGFAIYAVLRHLGRAGVADLVDRTCAMARLFADRLGALPGVRIVNDVVINQVLVAFDDADPGAVAAAVRASGDAFVTPSKWDGRPVLRISVSGWRTDAADVERTVAAIERALRDR